MFQRRPTFLGDDPDHDQLLAAVGAIQRAWMTRVACAGDGKVHRERGTEWIYSAGHEPEVTIAFSRWTGREAGKGLDRILSACRRIQGLRQVACWSVLEQPSPPELGAILAARGFEWGWRPHWMWLHLHRLSDSRRESIPVRIEVVSDDAPWDAKDLPYCDPDTFSRLVTLARAEPRRVWHFAAFLDGRPVGHSVLSLTTGALGVAGIFNVGVWSQRSGVRE